MSTTGQPLHVRAVPAGVAALAVTNLVLGLWMAFSPRSFYDAIGPFGPYNDHYVRDVATWYLAFGAALVAAVRRPSWRAPLLGLAVLQYGLHTVNHVVDVGDADPGWVGVFDAVVLGLTTVLLAGLFRGALESEHTRA
jgi:hypothetical protein